MPKAAEICTVAFGSSTASTCSADRDTQSPGSKHITGSIWNCLSHLPLVITLSMHVPDSSSSVSQQQQSGGKKKRVGLDAGASNNRNNTKLQHQLYMFTLYTPSWMLLQLLAPCQEQSLGFWWGRWMLSKSGFKCSWSRSAYIRR
jgi:hypothetical protein